MDLSIVIPLHNEETAVQKNVKQCLAALRFKGKYEVILVDNGSQDRTLEKAKELAKEYDCLKVRHLSERGIGLALREGVNHASGKLVFWTGVDFAFGFSIVDDSLAELKNCGLLINSKYHPQSINKSSWKRKGLSLTYHLILYLIFGLKIKDPQGSVLFKRELAAKVLPYCVSDNAFFETQFVLYADLFGFRIKEMPVEYLKVRSKSKFPIFREGAAMLKDIFKEVRRYYRIKKEVQDNTSLDKL